MASWSDGGHHVKAKSGVNVFRLHPGQMGGTCPQIHIHQSDYKSHSTRLCMTKKDKFTYIFCSIINNSIEEADYRQTYLCQMYAPVEASGGQEWYYIRSAWHLQSDVRSAWHLQSGMPRSDTPLVEASGGQEWYYIRSAWHLPLDVRSAWHLQSGMPRSDVPSERHLVAKSGTTSGQLDIYSEM